MLSPALFTIITVTSSDVHTDSDKLSASLKRFILVESVVEIALSSKFTTLDEGEVKFSGCGHFFYIFFFINHIHHFYSDFHGQCTSNIVFTR